MVNLRKMDTLKGEANLSKTFWPLVEKRFILKGMNLLPAIFWKGLGAQTSKQEVKVISLVQNGRRSTQVYPVP